MSIISAAFLIFLLSFGILYFILPKKMQWAVLLAGNLVFYAYSGSRFLIYLIGCALVTWFAALRIDRESLALKEKSAQTGDKEAKAALRKSFETKKKLWLGAGMILTLGVWIVLKYSPFLLDSFASLFRLDHLRGSLRFIVPLGMSFYTFDALSYMLDVSRGKYRAERNFFRYLTFVSFFPHIIQGPFSRYDTLGKTLFAEHTFSYDRLCEGSSRILWGYFKKLIIADKLAAAVSEVFANYESYWGMNILFVMILYGIQIYADFSGYMDIILGISRVLGISPEENFRQPYFSVSVEEFWRRWHMTLSHWFREYLFYPVSRSAGARKIRNRFSPEIARHLVNFIAMFWVWSASGLWHGANWTFLVWGWLNMAVMLFSQIAEPLYQKIRAALHIDPENKVWRLFRMVRTFLIVCFLFFIIRADSLSTVLQMLKRIPAALNRKLLLHPLALFPNMRPQDVVIVLIGVVMMAVVDILSEKGIWGSVKEKTPFLIRNCVYVLIIFMLILFAGTGSDITANFIYANF